MSVYQEVKDDVRSTAFYDITGMDRELIVRIYAFTGDERDEIVQDNGLMEIGRSRNTTYAAELPENTPSAFRMDTQTLAERFHIFSNEWSTEEMSG